MKRIFSHFILSLFIILTLNGCFFKSNSVEEWDLEPNGSTAFALSPDGRFALLYSQEHQLVFWDLKKRTQLAELGPQDPQAHTVNLIRISDNDRYAVTATQTNFAVWDLGLAQADGLWSISDGTIRDIDIASNGQQILLGLSNGKAIYVDLVNGRRIEFLAHREKVNTVALSPNGRYALTGGNDHTAYLWDTQNANIILTLQHEHRVNKVALQRQGAYAFTSDDGNDAFIWNLKTGEKQSHLKSFSRQLIFSTARFAKNGRYLLTGTPGSQVAIWNTTSGEKIDDFIAKPQKDARPPRAVVYDVALDKQQRIISATSAGVAEAWECEE
ncbi:MAG: WD40 repeat domain-containing protein [Vibrio sp.]